MILKVKLGSSLAFCLTSLQTGMQSAFWSSLSNLSKNLTEMRLVQIVRQSALNGPVWQSYYLTNIVDSLPVVCKDSLANFCYVFQCCACRRSTDVHLSLKRLYHKKALFWHMALSPKASCSTGWVSAAVFFKIETKFDADYLLPKIGHISCKKIHRITKT